MADTKMLGTFCIVCKKHLTVLTQMLSFNYLQDLLLLLRPCGQLREGYIQWVASKARSHMLTCLPLCAHGFLLS